MPLRDRKAATKWETSITGRSNPNLAETLLLKVFNFGSNSFAAGPPSVPNSLNICQAERMKREAKRTRPRKEKNPICTERERE